MPSPLFPLIWPLLRGIVSAGLLSALLSSSLARAGEIAVLPTDAPGLLPGVRESLDAQLHAALGGAGLTVQDAGKTQRFVKDAVDAGLSCSLSEDDCALKVAIAAGVDAVVVVRAVIVDERLVVELRKVAVDGAAPVGVAGVVDAAPADQESLARLARRLTTSVSTPAGTVSLEPATELPVVFNIEPPDVMVSVDGKLVDDAQVARGVLWLQPGPHLVQISRSGYDARPVAVDVTADRLPPPVTVALEKAFPLLVGVGIGVGIGGAMLAVASAVGVGIVESALAEPQTPTARETLTISGRMLLGGAVVGAIAAGSGAVVAVMGGAE